jgi:predicted nuclease of restriction endonuclease-like (RecB) superfamily
MAERNPRKSPAAFSKAAQARPLRKHPSAGVNELPDYRQVLADTVRLIQDSRRRALATVNYELVCLYWRIGQIIVQQQEQARWGDGVVGRFAKDLRLAFPDMKGLTCDNVFRMKQFFESCLEIDRWLQDTSSMPIVGTVSRQMKKAADASKVGTVSPLLHASLNASVSAPLVEIIVNLSWSHHYVVIGACKTPAERYFYLKTAVAERWSVREMRRQIAADLFRRYVSVRSHPEKCLPADAESGDLLPFKDHYVLEFLGLGGEYSELQLRRAILANLRSFFLKFGKDLTFVGEEYPLTVGGDTFHIDLLLFHRRLQCLIAVELKKGKFKPEYAGKSRFYCAALDEFIKLPDEAPSLGLVLCRDADAAQVRLALTDAAKQIGIATYQTALPDERLIRQRIEQLPQLPEDNE